MTDEGTPLVEVVDFVRIQTFAFYHNILKFSYLKPSKLDSLTQNFLKGTLFDYSRINIIFGPNC